MSVRRIGAAERRARLAIRHHQQTIRSIPEIFCSFLQKPIGAFLDVFAEGSALCRLRKINGFHQLGIVARTERISPIITQVGSAEDKQADMRALRNFLQNFL